MEYNSTRFPSGISVLADWLHNKGRPIYLKRLIICISKVHHEKSRGACFSHAIVVKVLVLM